MTGFFGRRRGPDDFDAMLDGTATTDSEVGLVLDAARAPAAADSGGLDAAMAAFRRADPPRREGRSGRIWRRTLATTLTTKIVAGASVAVAAAGIGVASTRPSPPPRPAPTTSAPSSAPTGGGGSASGSTGPSRTPASSSASGSTSGSGSTSAAPGALGPLCARWLTDPAQQPVLAQRPEFWVLITAAGGADGVTAFCTQRDPGPTPTPSSGQPSSDPRPTPSGRSTGTPSGRVTRSPSTAQTTRPTSSSTR